MTLPPHLIDTVDNVINMPNNVHDNNDNDVLAHIYIYIPRQIYR